MRYHHYADICWVGHTDRIRSNHVLWGSNHILWGSPSETSSYKAQLQIAGQRQHTGIVGGVNIIKYIHFIILKGFPPQNLQSNLAIIIDNVDDDIILLYYFNFSVTSSIGFLSSSSISSSFSSLFVKFKKKYKQQVRYEVKVNQGNSLDIQEVHLQIIWYNPGTHI